MMFDIKKPSKTEFQQIHIPAGKHAARPKWFEYGRRSELKMQYLFADSCAYELPSVDQQDWNKLCGLSFQLFTNHRNSAMVSWRWNNEKKVVELGFYYHIGGKRLIRRNDKGSEVFTEVKISGMCRISMAVDHLTGTVSTIISRDDDAVQDVIQMKTNRRARVINPWFGGNRAAPHDIYMLRKLI